MLVGRNADKMSAIANDLKVRGAKAVQVLTADLSDLTRHAAIIDTAKQQLGGLDAALIAHGTLGDQQKSAADVQDMLQEFNTNGLSYLSLMTLLGNVFEQQGHGTLAVISSVAGERGRGSNYVYGSAKGAVSLFAQGLRNRLSKSGVAVVTIKPGFVDTPITAGLKKNPLYASAELVGKRVTRRCSRAKTLCMRRFSGHSSC